MRIERRKKVKIATTTEDRLWAFVGDQAEILMELATSEYLDNERKKLLADAPYDKIKKALRQLGVFL